MHKPRLNTIHKKTLGPTGLYELVLVAVHMENFHCTAKMPGTTSAALPSFSHVPHHKTDAAKRKGGPIISGYSLKDLWGTSRTCGDLLTWVKQKKTVNEVLCIFH